MLSIRAPRIISRATQNSSLSAKCFVRNLNLHEYQSKDLLNSYGVNTQRWRLATNPEEAEKGAKELAAPELVVKAQIHAGGRGLGVYDNGFKGGVHLVKTPKEVKDLAGKMLGARLKTKQTPPEGVLVNKLMVAASVDIKKEYYFAILLDRAANGPVMIASPQGGMDIEKVAHETPDLIFRENVNIFKGPSKEQTQKLAEKLGITGSLIPKFQDQVSKIYDMFIKTDATQVEINPLAVVNEGEIYAVDAKLNFDDNAEFRQKNIFLQDDPAESDPREVAAAKHGLNYVGMNGNIGCMVNGAGLAMATMDIIKLHKGEPANFLDVGGGADEARVTEAFKIITADPQVKAILVNIFGGIVKCDLIAQGIINAYKQINLKIPIIVRLAGTNVDLGYKLLKESGLKMTTANDLEDAAIKATAVLNKH